MSMVLSVPSAAPAITSLPEDEHFPLAPQALVSADLFAEASSVVEVSSAPEETTPADESAELLEDPAVPVRLALPEAFTTAADFAARSPGEVTWLAPPLVAAGAVTLFDGKAKSGKTTFLAKLVAAVAKGSPFLGQPTSKTRVVYATEEGTTTFKRTLVRAGLLNSLDVIVLQHRDVSREPWASVVDRIARTCEETGARVVVIDTLAKFAPEAEGSAAKALAAMAPLQKLKDMGVGVIVTRHQRKAGGTVGDSGRGSNALTGDADIVMAFCKPPGHTGKARIISAMSRFDETPAEIAVELRGCEYVLLDGVDVVTGDAEKSILALLPPDQGLSMAVDDVLDLAGLKKTAGRALLARMAHAGKVVVMGAGTRGSPLRYHLPATSQAQPDLDIRGTAHSIEI